MSVLPFKHADSLASIETTTRPREHLAGPLPEKWQFNHGVAEITEPVHELLHCQGEYLGEVASRFVTMEDGSKYGVRYGRPASQKIDTAVVKTTAYMTRYDAGMNVHHQRKDLKRGYPSLLISRELDWEGDLNQGRTAYNMARITKLILENDGYVDPVNIEAAGISRAAMLCLGMKALTAANPDLKLNVYYFNGVVPTYPEPLHLGLEYVTWPLKEGASLAYHSARLPLKLMGHYSETVDVNPRAMKAGAKALTTGEAGEFVEHIPQDLTTHGYILGYVGDTMGMGKTWQHKFAEHDGVRVETTGGKLFQLIHGHLRVVNQHDLEEYGRRQERLSEERRGAASLHGIDYNYVNGG